MAPTAHVRPSMIAWPAVPPSQLSHSGKARKTPTATSPRPARSRWRCSTTGRRGRQEDDERRARAFGAARPFLAAGLRLGADLDDVRAGGIGGSVALSTPTAPDPAPPP